MYESFSCQARSVRSRLEASATFGVMAIHYPQLLSLILKLVQIYKTHGNHLLSHHPHD